MHIFSSHLDEFVKIHGDVNKFNIQGLEKLNDITTIQYHKSTSKHPKLYLKQLLNKRNRIEYLSIFSSVEQNEVDSLTEEEE